MYHIDKPNGPRYCPFCDKDIDGSEPETIPLGHTRCINEAFKREFVAMGGNLDGPFYSIAPPVPPVG